MKSLSMKVAESSKAIPCSLSGSSNIRRCEVTTVCSGTIDARQQSTHDGRKSRSFEADPRCTYIDLGHLTSMEVTQLVNQQDIGYTESLTLFVKDLGPTPQKIARKKLPLPNGHLVL
ncbi:unnamed protein product [Prunus armeniaca]|uniref:Uncharacterized protein n=1 Tax=Prunus armeniaca TaxID=36596 RepID=A0A6J5XUM3_PRUAR|nr:unnamed protein product [Prunus armeniaca]